MDEDAANQMLVDDVKIENEAFQDEDNSNIQIEEPEKNQDNLNDLNNQQEDNDKEDIIHPNDNSQNGQDSNQDENDEEDEDEEDDEESDDEITITINDINTAVANSSTNANTSFTYQPVNLNLNKRAPFGPGGQVTNLNAASNKQKQTGLDIEKPGQYNGQSIYDLNLDSLEDKPWRKPGADITDYFNYGFTEDTWKIYCDRQKRLRNEINSTDNQTNNDRHLQPANNQQNANQNGNNIVLRTFTNNTNNLTLTNVNTGHQNLNQGNLTQIKSELSSINENSKYGGSGMLIQGQGAKKAGPPPGRKTSKFIDNFSRMNF